MEYAEFENRLKSLELSKKEFACIVDIQYESVINWKHKKIPKWIKSWLYYYEKSKILDNITNELKNLENLNKRGF